MTAHRPRGFRATWGLPLLAGPALTAILVGWLYLTSDPAGWPPPPRQPMPEVDRASLRNHLEGEGALDAADGAIRDVTAEGVTPGRDVAGPLVRVAPDPPAADPPPPRDLHHRVVVLDAGSFRVVKDKAPVVVRIAGIKAPTFDQTCEDASGKTWKCGARGRAELARLIGSRAVGCTPVDETDPAAPLAVCRVGPRDLAAWLVEQGWADPLDPADAALADLAARAKAERRGRFGTAPLGVIAG